MYDPFVLQRTTVFPFQQRDDSHLCLKMVVRHVNVLRKHIENVIVSNPQSDDTQVVSSQCGSDFCSNQKYLDQLGRNSHARASFNIDSTRVAPRRTDAELSVLMNSSAWRMTAKS
jgi:hypothetical protein